jgi:hypothetical protein
MLFGNSHEQWDLFQFPELVTRLAKAEAVVRVLGNSGRER